MSIVAPLVHAFGAPANARTAALLRIAVAFAAFLVWLEEGPVLAALNDPRFLHVPYAVQVPQILLTAIPAVWIVAALGLALGFAPRLAAAVLAATLTVTLLADQQLYSNHLHLLLLLVMLIALTDTGAIGPGSRRHPMTVPGWPVRLIAAQVTIVYAFAALSKLNPSYLSGTVMGAYLRDGGVLALPEGWRSFELLFAVSLLGVLLEGFLAIALWLPRWRRTAFVAGLALHASIAIWLEPTSQLVTFGLLMLPLYLAFLDPRPRSVAVVWDDQCSFCRSWIGWGSRLDWLHALRLVPASDETARDALGVTEQEALYALQVVTNDQRASGYDAVVCIAEVLPLSFVWAPILRLPPIAKIGRRVYRKVADRRRCGLDDHGRHRHAAEQGAADVSV